MKINDLLESSNLYSREKKRIARDAKKFRRQIDRDKEKKKKEEERNYKKQARLSKKLTKSNINTLLKEMKTASKTKASLQAIVDELDPNQVKKETLDFIKWVVKQTDRLKTKKKEGTVLVTRNFSLVPKILNNSVVSKNKDPKVIASISKLVRTSNIELNPKFNPKNKTSNYRMINNVLFNSIRDLVLELIRSDMMELQGANDGD